MYDASAALAIETLMVYSIMSYSQTFAAVHKKEVGQNVGIMAVSENFTLAYPIQRLTFNTLFSKRIALSTSPLLASQNVDLSENFTNGFLLYKVLNFMELSKILAV